MCSYNGQLSRFVYGAWVLSECVVFSLSLCLSSSLTRIHTQFQFRIFISSALAFVTAHLLHEETYKNGFCGERNSNDDEDKWNTIPRQPNKTTTTTTTENTTVEMNKKPTEGNKHFDNM